MTNILFLSLVQDISALEALILRIYDVQKDTTRTINSWRLPTKTFLDTINFKIDETQPTSFQYTTILEVVIDRLYILLNQYLDHTANMTARYFSLHLQHDFVRPRRISLGALNHNLWKKIQSICELKEIHKKTSIAEVVSNKEVQIVNAESQTEEIHSSQCNSCFVAVNCIKSIACEMESLLPNGFTEKNRKQLEPNIFELTQFGCMNSIINAILADAQVLSENIKKAQNDCQEESKRNSILQNKLENNSKSLTEVKIEQTKIEEKNEKLLIEVENSKSELRSKCESEDTYKGLLKTVSQELQVVKDMLNCAERQLETVQFNNTILNRQIENLQKQQELIIVERDMWKVQHISTQENNTSLKLQREDLENQVSDLMDSVQRTSESLKSINLFMEVNGTKIDEKINKHGILLNKLQETVENTMMMQEQEIIKLKKTRTTIASPTHYFQKHESNPAIMNGNPIEDMSKQIELNKSNMKKLKAQNDTLISTINKLQAIQVKKRLSIF